MKSPVRTRADETGATLAAAMLAPAEIKAAAVLIESESGSMPPEEMVKAVSNLFGFKRLGTDLRSAIENALEFQGTKSTHQIVHR